MTDVDLFQKVEGATVVISRGGIYQQTDLYEHDDMFFAAVRGGFVRLRACSGTSHPKITWKKISGVPFFEQFDGPRRMKPEKTTSKSVKKRFLKKAA